MTVSDGARGHASARRSRSAWRLFAAPALLLALLLSACGSDGEATPTSTATSMSTATANEAAGGIEAVDSSGFTLALDGPAQRIVSHSPAATEILFAIGAGDQVVAADEFSYYPPEAADLPKVAYTSPDPEAALAHDPDLVILAVNQELSIEQFRTLGLPVFFLEEPTDISGVMDDIRVLGRLTGHDEEAEDLATDLEERLDAVEAALADVETGPRVFYELDATLFTVGPDSFIGSALALLKAENIAAGAPSAYPQLTAEAVVEADPEVILLADHDFGVTVESVTERPGWSEVTAVREGRLHPVDPDVMSRPGPRIVDGIESLAALLYPDRFE